MSEPLSEKSVTDGEADQPKKLPSLDDEAGDLGRGLWMSALVLSGLGAGSGGGGCWGGGDGAAVARTSRCKCGGVALRTNSDIFFLYELGL